MNITSANAQILLTVPLLFPQPFLLSKFAADNIFGTDPIQRGETVMGVDGYFTAGFVYTPTKQSYSLLADSDSNYFFDQVAMREQADQTKYEINGVVLLTSVGTKWTMTRGFLQMWQPIPDAGKVLKERKHTIEWSRVIPNPS